VRSSSENANHGKIGHFKGFQMSIFGHFEPRVFPRLDTKCTW
jgi:hypothetical protein